MYLAATDLDECSASENNAGCDHYCENTEGSYRCSCKALYAVNNNGHTCDGSTSFIAVAGSVGGIIILLILIVTTGVCVWKCKTHRNKYADGIHDPPNPL